MQTVMAVIALALGLLLGVGITFAIFQRRIKDKRVAELRQAEVEVREILAHAREESQRIKKEGEVAVKESYLTLKAELDKNNNEHQNRLNSLEKRLIQREDNLDKKSMNLENRERDLHKSEQQIKAKEREIDELKEKQKEIILQEESELERISGLSAEQARKVILEKIEQDSQADMAKLLRKMEEDYKKRKDLLAREIMATAIQSSAAEYVIESTVSVVDLPSDEMKGRIIGREGRNIRALEMLTGTNLIIDDTPEAVIISSADPIKREIARRSLKTLVEDGRINPARIEEVIEETRKKFEEALVEDGEAAALEFGLKNVHGELIKLLGRLRYRTSYGQNVLEHSLEVAAYAGKMAAEIGANVETATRAGLLHDIGKAIDREVEGTHTEIGVKVAQKCGESEAVVLAIAAHHKDIDFPSVEAMLVQAADSLSAARPGARREILEIYLKRLESLEKLAQSFQGVSKAYALQAGREVRIIVDSDRINDNEAILMARNIAVKVENELEYPGQIKVTVVREKRIVEFAR